MRPESRFRLTVRQAGLADWYPWEGVGILAVVRVDRVKAAVMPATGR
jgi:hypothetical protein